MGVYRDERSETAARFLLETAAFFASCDVRIQEVITDRAFAYIHSHDFAEATSSLPIRHIVTRPYLPQTNGKARFIQTMLRQWAYRRLYRSNQERLDALPRWLRFYNGRRPHTALEGKSPMTPS